DTLVKPAALNDAMHQLMLSTLDARAWRAELPSQKRGGRTIAAIFAHLHNCRLVWLRNSASYLKCPAPLDPFRCTIKQAVVAHKKSTDQCLRMLTDALWATRERHVTNFSLGTWVPVWPPCATMFSSPFSHH